MSDPNDTTDPPLIDLRTLVILAMSAVVGIVVGLSGGLGSGVVAGLGAAGVLHVLVGRR